MRNVRILCVGKLKERYLTDACAEYLKRLQAYCRPEVIELPESRLPDHPSAAEIEACIRREGEEILAKIPKDAWVVPMCIEGKMLSSEELAAELDRAAVAGNSSACFIIGGSHGLSEAVKNTSRLRLSMSKMTFPHQLARVMLLEQIYRAFSINAGTKYHK
ncbi:MAG: 23S rRNA (pseudouridine(1915)-N(3))-methyltransferase RlmH [Candidatus Merdivicinus sp.]|jgi:23S rRNA (pseudouridine1915-N3)-methyltransferase